MELTAHARREITRGNGTQQRGNLLQVVIADLHHGVEVFDHRAEVVVKAHHIATLAEIPHRRRPGQIPDLGIDGAQVGLGGIHCSSEGGLLAGQAVHVRAQVTDRVALHHFDQATRDRDVGAHQLVGVFHHLAVLAREGLRVHAVAQLAPLMSLGHLTLRGHHRAQLAAHALHRFKQPADLIIARGRQRCIQTPLGHLCGQADGIGQRTDRLTAQQHVHAAAEHQCRTQTNGQDDPQQRTCLRSDQRMRHDHTQREMLFAAADAQRHVGLHVACRIRFEGIKGLVCLDRRQYLRGQRILAALADLAGVLRGQHDAAGRDQFHMAFLHGAQRGQVLLQCGQREVHRHRTNKRPLVDHRGGQRGHQHLLTADLVGVGLGDGLPLERLRLEIPVAIAGHVIAGQRILHRRAVVPGPVAHEPAGIIVCLGADELGILAIEGVGFPQRAEAHPFRVHLHLLVDHRRHRRPRQRSRSALHQQVLRQRLAGGESTGEITTHPQRFGLGLALHGVAGGIHQRRAGFAIADGSGDTEAEHGDQRRTQHQSVGDAARALGSSGAGHGHGGGSGKRAYRRTQSRAATETRSPLRAGTHAVQSRRGQQGSMQRRISTGSPPPLPGGLVLCWGSPRRTPRCHRPALWRYRLPAP